MLDPNDESGGRPSPGAPGFGNPGGNGEGVAVNGNGGNGGGLTPEQVQQILAQAAAAGDAASQAYWDNYIKSGAASKSTSAGSVRANTPPYEEGPNPGENKWNEFLLTLQQQQADLAEKQRQANQTNMTAEERLALDRQIQHEQKTIQEEKNQIDRGTLQETINRDNMNSVDSFQKNLMSQTGPEDTFRYLFNSRGYQAPRGYAAAPLPMTSAQRQAMGLPPGGQYVPGGNQDNPLAFLGNLPPSLQPNPGDPSSFAPTGGAGYGQGMQGQPGYGQQPSPWMGINNGGPQIYHSIDGGPVQFPGPQNAPPQGVNLLTPHTGALDSTLTGDYSWMWRDPANPGAGWQFGEPPKGAHIEWTQTPQELMRTEQAGGQNPWGTGKVDPNTWLGSHGYATSGQQNNGGGYTSGINWGGGVDGVSGNNLSNSGFGQPPPYQYPGASSFRDSAAMGAMTRFQSGIGAAQMSSPQIGAGINYGTPTLQVGQPNMQPNPTLQVGAPPPNEASRVPTLQVGTPDMQPKVQPSPMIGVGSPQGGQYGGGAAIPGLPDFSKIGNLPPFLQGLANQTAGGPQFVKPSMQQWNQMNNSEQGAYGSALGDLSGINRKDVIDKIPEQTQGMSTSPGATDIPTKFT